MKGFIYVLMVLGMVSCGAKNKPSTTKPAEEATLVMKEKTTFNVDSAYLYIKTQEDFGPRVPNTKAHDACGKYLVSQLQRYGAKVFEQDMMLTAYNGEKLKSKNVIGSYLPEAKDRILLFAHWDSRPYADHDPDPANYHTPIMGTDDGASGVGVLLEVARQLQVRTPNVGIDIIFFDTEDYGAPSFDKGTYTDDWCLGTQFWTKNPHVKNYTAKFGILLDMVGAKNATFYKEYISQRYAARYVDLIWDQGRDLGYGKFFINADGGGITDDHEYVIKGLGIPCVDIINYDPNSKTGFGWYWHTLKDTIDNIDKETLQAVGETLMEVIYKQK